MRKADNLTTILGHCHIIFNSLEPSGPLGPVMGLIFTLKKKTLDAWEKTVSTY